jgi:hypothetical protein
LICCGFHIPFSSYFSSLESGPAESPRRKASTYPLFSQHPGREALIEPLSRMPREIPWKPGFTLDQLIKQSRGVFLGSEIIGGAPWGWNVPLGNNTHEAELKLSPTDHRDWFIVGRIATFQTDNTPGVLPQRDHPGWDLSSLRDFALYPTPYFRSGANACSIVLVAASGVPRPAAISAA